MGNPLMQNRSQANNGNNEKMYEEFRQNPANFLIKCGLNIPADFQGDYRAMVQHLANTGQIPPALRGRVQAMLQGVR